MRNTLRRASLPVILASLTNNAIYRVVPEFPAIGMVGAAMNGAMWIRRKTS